MKRVRFLPAVVASGIALAAAAGLTTFALTRPYGPKALAASPTTKPLWTCVMHPQVIQDHPGNCPICRMKLVPLRPSENVARTDPKRVAYWWDPMLGPGSISKQPGKSAMGMDLVPVYESEARSGPGVQIDPAVVQNMGVVIAPVTRGPLHVTVRAVGTLEVPQPAMHDVAVKVGGYIEKLTADTEGMSVRQGQVLFELYSPDLQVASRELISGEQTLRTAGDASSAVVRQDAQELVDRTTRKLQLWGVADQDIAAIAADSTPPLTVPFRSPATGHVADKTVVVGSSVTAGQKLMRIENHSMLWLDAQVYEEQIEQVKVGDAVHAAVEGLPGRNFDGAVSFIYPHMDHMARTELVRTQLANPEHRLRPGMYATVDIVTRPIDDAVLTPGAAVIDTGLRKIVFVADPASPGHFDPRQVTTGVAGDDGLVQVISGLAPGDQVVTSGQFLMDVESRTAEAIEKMRGAGDSTSMRGAQRTPTPSAANGQPASNELLR